MKISGLNCNGGPPQDRAAHLKLINYSALDILTCAEQSSMSLEFCCINNAHGLVYNLCKWTCNHLKLKCMSEGRVACCACVSACMSVCTVR